MEVIGFIFMVITLISFSFGWCFLLLLDVTLGGKRELSIYVMMLSLGVIIWGWISLVNS